jgi:hypothetical protein
VTVENAGQNQVAEKLLGRRLLVGEAEALLLRFHRPGPFVMSARNALGGAGVHVDDHPGFLQSRPHRLVLRLVIAAVFDSRRNLHAPKSQLGVAENICDRMVNVED